MNIAVFANTSWYIYNFRLNTMKALRDQGYNVIAIGPADPYVEKIKAEGFQHIEITMKGSSVNPLFELKTLFNLYQCFRKNQIKLTLSFTPKANIYASLLAAPLRMYTLSNVSGLGRLFIHPSFTTKIAKQLYRFAFMFSEHIFFQNNDDRQLFLTHGIVKEHKTSLLPGSGVDLKKFHPDHSIGNPPPDGKNLEFLLVARMLWDKGIGEYIKAARIVRDKYPNVKFKLLGDTGADNPSSIPKSELDKWVSEGVVTYLGKTNNVHEHLLNADCTVLPSYREGTPKSLLEAAASGKPLITTDVPGCRNVIEDETTGFLCNDKDPKDLAEKMIKMIKLSPEKRLKMGMQGRRKMESQFDEKLVINQYSGALHNIPNDRYKIRSKLLEHLTT